jgi:hypothetical protein
MARSHLQSTEDRTWTFEVLGSFQLDAPQEAKRIVYEENDDVNYRDLRARIMLNGAYDENSVVTVTEVR